MISKKQLKKVAKIGGGVAVGGLAGAAYGNVAGSIAGNKDRERLREHLKNGKGIDSRKYVTKQGYRYVGDKKDLRKGDFGLIGGLSVGSLIQSTKDGKNAYSHQPKHGPGMVLAGKKTPKDVLDHEIGHLKDMAKNGKVRGWEYTPIGSVTGHQMRREESAWKESGHKANEDALNTYRKLRTGSRIGAAAGAIAGGILAHKKFSMTARLCELSSRLDAIITSTPASMPV